MMELWMTLVGMSMSLPAIIQIVKVVRLKRANQIAITSYALFVHGSLWWTYYGYYNSTSVMITNAFSVILNAVAIAPTYFVEILDYEHQWVGVSLVFDTLSHLEFVIHIQIRYDNGQISIVDDYRGQRGIVSAADPKMLRKIVGLVRGI